MKQQIVDPSNQDLSLESLRSVVGAGTVVGNPGTGRPQVGCIRRKSVSLGFSELSNISRNQ